VSNRYEVTFRDCVNMMFIDAIWMGVLSWYIATIWPSEFGTQKPFYFLCLPSYWKSCFSCFFSKIPHRPSEVDNLQRQVNDGTCVEIKDLYKIYDTTKGKKVAVDGLNLTMYSGQVTALLGHNGAGKVSAER
jgi:ATP-binding cassette, subfamily A (ABC1), member 3